MVDFKSQMMLLLFCLMVQQAASFRTSTKSRRNRTSDVNLTDSTMQGNVSIVTAPIVLNANWQDGGSYGGGGGSDFNHYHYNGLGGAIHEICVRSGSRLDRIEVNYAGRKMAHGGGGGDWDCFPLNSGETITRVIIRTGSEVDSIRFVTSAGRWSRKYGGNGGDERTLSAPAGKHLMALYGRSGSRVDRLGLYWGSGGGTGSWVALRNCVGCGTVRFKLTECSERGGSNSDQLTTEWSMSVSKEISAGFEYMGITGGAKVNIDTSYSEQTVSRTESSFMDTRCVEKEFTCDKHYLWQWSFQSNFDGLGSVSTHAPDKVCTDEPNPCCLPGTFTAQSGPRSCVLNPGAPNTCR